MGAAAKNFACSPPRLTDRMLPETIEAINGDGARVGVVAEGDQHHDHHRRIDLV
jgi:hypothetical protein